MSDALDAGVPGRGPGRPRKWENEAERARAYRQRRASELEGVEQLRRDRRALQRTVRTLSTQLARAERQAETASRRTDELRRRLDQSEAEVARLRVVVERLGEQDRPQPRPPEGADGLARSLAEPGGAHAPLNRAQRRRLAKKGAR